MCSNTNNPKFPCKTCAKNVHDKDEAVQYDLCEHWIHTKCNNLNYLDYRYIQNCIESWYCKEFCSKIFSFNSLSCDKNFLACCTITNSSIMQWDVLKSAQNSSLLLKPTPNLGLDSMHPSFLLGGGGVESSKTRPWKNLTFRWGLPGKKGGGDFFGGGQGGGGFKFKIKKKKNKKKLKKTKI